jgi:UDP-glucose 4-epimerase
MKLNNNNEKINILVTGGAGYVGSILCSHLKRKYKNTFKVYVIDNLSSGKKKYLKCDKFFKIDLKNNSKLNNFFKRNRVDTVVHLAGYTNLRDKNLKKFYVNNFLATKNLVDNIIKFNIETLIFSSTASVYGNPTKIPIAENSKTQPISHYGKSKLKAENYIKKFSLGNFKSIIFRFFNASGANTLHKIGEDKNPPEHLIPIILNGFIKKKEVTIFNNFKTSDGTGVRDYIHVEDIVMALIKAVNYSINMKKKYIVLNLGSGKGVSSLSIIKKLETLLKKKINYLFSTKRIGEPDILLSSIKKVRREIDWLPKKNINKILKDAVFWEKYIYNNDLKNSQ